MKKFLVLVAAVCMAYTTAFAQTVKPFKEGDRAVFLGNSITDGGRYHSYIWLYYMTRFPNMPIRVFNGGIGGDTAYDMNKRLDGDIFSKNPTVLMVTFGMNDSGYYEYNGDNAKEFVSTLIKLKPTAAKGTYIKSIYLSSTMSPGIKIDPKSVDEI